MLSWKTSSVVPKGGRLGTTLVKSLCETLTALIDSVQLHPKMNLKGGSMSFALEGKTALVTGASRGNGKAIAERLAADGAAGVLHYNREEQTRLMSPFVCA